MELLLMAASFVGGLAMFLYGMKVMGAGLERLSGGKLERILERLTSNKLKGVLLGLIVTAVLQCSSATTVMVVGFVNSGIMQLSQATGVIMGANIGTTVTAWLLSLSGIGGSGFLQMLNPSFFAPIFAIIAVFILSSKKKGRKNDIATIMIGFALLMIGMDAMKSAIEPLADNPEFSGLMTMFSNPVLGVICGAVVTAVMQSSSASVGILQAVSSTGTLTFGGAIPIIMGQNIGACVPALISSAGTTKNGKRAAMIHLYFNVIGTILFLIVYYVLNKIFSFSFDSAPISPVSIAVVHTVFNTAAVVVMLPFSKLLEKLARLTIRDGKTTDENYGLLDERFLSTPSFAIDQCHTLSVKMAALTQSTLADAVNMLSAYDPMEGEEIIANENRVDEFEDKIGTYLVKLNSKDISDKDSKEISLLLHCIGDIERISDHAVNILEAAQEMYTKGLFFSDKAKEELRIYIAAIMEIVDMAFSAFENEDVDRAKTVEPLEEVIDNLRNELKKHHIKRLRKGKCTIETGFVLQDLLTNFERIADHCSNIAVCLIQIQEDSFETHEYINELKKTEDSFFLEKFTAFSEKYALPKKVKE
ncbi:MAG: Na/Pi cotransporter family protein [Firmicutes bacterium]|nr:Na/Pi cotransporter family protein [[Eubacterium] siraeum]MCM1487762.1 Na/Pi cotransporter family protein [Bacillota bacterium]